MKVCFAGKNGYCGEKTWVSDEKTMKIQVLRTGEKYNKKIPEDNQSFLKDTGQYGNDMTT